MARQSVCLCEGEIFHFKSIFTVRDGKQIIITERVEWLLRKDDRSISLRLCKTIHICHPKKEVQKRVSEKQIVQCLVDGRLQYCCSRKSTVVRTDVQNNDEVLK